MSPREKRSARDVALDALMQVDAARGFWRELPVFQEYE